MGGKLWQGFGEEQRQSLAAISSQKSRQTEKASNKEWFYSEITLGRCFPRPVATPPPFPPGGSLSSTSLPPRLAGISPTAGSIKKITSAGKMSIGGPWRNTAPLVPSDTMSSYILKSSRWWHWGKHQSIAKLNWYRQQYWMLSKVCQNYEMVVLKKKSSYY